MNQNKKPNLKTVNSKNSDQDLQHEQQKQENDRKETLLKKS